MKSDLPTVFDLVESPELAPLHALQTALTLAGRALEAAHPDLDEADLHEEPFSVEGYLADAILTHIGGLDVAIQRYRHLIEYRRRRLLTRSGDF